MHTETDLIVACLRRYHDHLIQDYSAPERQALREDEPPGNFRRLTVAEDVVAGALSMSLLSAFWALAREAGWRVWGEGGVTALRALANAVAGIMTEAPEFALATLDKWWDGVGRTRDQDGWRA